MKLETIGKLDPVWADYRGLIKTPQRTRLHDAVQSLQRYSDLATPIDIGEDAYEYIGPGFLTLAPQLEEEAFFEANIFPAHDSFVADHKEYTSTFLEVYSRNPYDVIEPGLRTEMGLYSLFLLIAAERQSDGMPVDASNIFSHYVVSTYEHDSLFIQRPYVFHTHWDGDGPFPLNVNEQFAIDPYVLRPERAKTLEPYTLMAREIEKAADFLGQISL